MYDLKGKVALVTGAARQRGIGRAIAVRLALEGADVAVNGQHRAPEDLPPWEKKEGWLGLDSMVKEIQSLGRRGIAVTADVSNSKEVNSMVATTAKQLGRLDIVVNNAALVRSADVKPVIEQDEAVWNRYLAINLTGVFLVCKAAGKQMVEQGQGGKIINIASSLGKKGQAKWAHYCAAKFGVLGLTQCLALEMAPHKINVNAVCPGLTNTWQINNQGPLMAKYMQEGLTEEQSWAKVYHNFLPVIPLGRVVSVADVANVVAFLASNQSDYMTGQALNVTGGMQIGF